MLSLINNAFVSCCAIMIIICQPGNAQLEGSRNAHRVPSMIPPSSTPSCELNIWVGLGLYFAPNTVAETYVLPPCVQATPALPVASGPGQ